MILIDARALRDELFDHYAGSEIFLNERGEMDPLGEAYVSWPGVAARLDAAPTVGCDNCRDHMDCSIEELLRTVCRQEGLETEPACSLWRKP